MSDIDNASVYKYIHSYIWLWLQWYYYLPTPENFMSAAIHCFNLSSPLKTLLNYWSSLIQN